MSVILAIGCVCLGTFFVLLGTIGLYRLPDVFCRAHALTKAMTLGLSLLLVGMWIYLSGAGIGVKVFVAIVFQFATIPLAGHLLGMVAWKKNIRRFKHKDVITK